MAVLTLDSAWKAYFALGGYALFIGIAITGTVISQNNKGTGFGLVILAFLLFLGWRAILQHL
jgi:hypothetical protein